jgi:DnaD/phage-associated family protein
MAGMPWVKIYTEILDDVKLSRLTDSQRWRFIQFVIMAAEGDAGGQLVTGDIPMTHEGITWRLRCDPQILETDIKRLIDLGLIEESGGVISVPKFAERQGPTQAAKREQWKLRQEKHRIKIKDAIVTSESRVSHDTEEEKKKSREEEDAPPPPNIFKLYQNEVGVLSNMVSDELQIAEKEYPYEWIVKAIREAVDHNARNWKYIQTILKRYKIEGFKDNNNGHKLDKVYTDPDGNPIKASDL